MDRLSERLTRRLAGYTSRRGFLAKLGLALAAAPVLPLLPVARVTAAEPSPKTDFERAAQAKDPNKCNYGAIAPSTVCYAGVAAAACTLVRQAPSLRRFPG